jgi:hypothetical protein
MQQVYMQLTDRQSAGARSPPVLTTLPIMSMHMMLVPDVASLAPLSLRCCCPLARWCRWHVMQVKRSLSREYLIHGRRGVGLPVWGCASVCVCVREKLLTKCHVKLVGWGVSACLHPQISTCESHADTRKSHLRARTTCRCRCSWLPPSERNFQGRIAPVHSAAPWQLIVATARC